MSRGALLLIVAIVLAAAPPTRAADDSASAREKSDRVSFSHDVAPILAEQCLTCHGPKKAKGGYRVTSYELILKAGNSDDPSITPGDLENSQLYQLLIDPDEEFRMPQDGDALPEDQIATIRKWIEQGAEYDAPDRTAPLTSIIPTRDHPAAPQTYSHPLPITAIAYSPDGRELAVSGYHEVTIWNVADGALLRRIGNVARRTFAIAYSPDGRILAVAGGSPGEFGEVRLFEAADGHLLRVLHRTDDVELDVEFSPDGSTLATCGADQMIRIYDTTDWQVKRTIGEHSDWVAAITFSGDGARIGSASRDGTAKILDIATGKTVTAYRDHNKQVFDIAFATDGKSAFTSAADREIHAWKTDDGKQVGRIRDVNSDVLRVIVAGNSLLAAAVDGKVRRYDIADRKLLRTYADADDWLYALASDPTGERFTSGAYNGQVRIWTFDADEPLLIFEAAPGR